MNPKYLKKSLINLAQHICEYHRLLENHTTPSTYDRNHEQIGQQKV